MNLAIFNNIIIAIAAASTFFLLFSLVVAKYTKKILYILFAFLYCFTPLILFTIKQDSKIINAAYIINIIIFYITICYICVKAITTEYEFFGIVKFSKRYAYIILSAMFLNIVFSYSQLMVYDTLVNFIMIFLNYAFIAAFLVGVLSDIFKIKNIVFQKTLSSIVALVIITVSLNAFVYIFGVNHQFEHFYSPVHKIVFMKNRKGLAIDRWRNTQGDFIATEQKD